MLPVNTEPLLNVAIMLAELEEMRLTISYSIAGAAAATVAATGGFLLLGPAGIFLGSTAAGLAAYSFTKNKFKPVFAILKDDLRPHQQQELIDNLKEAFKDVDVMSVLSFGLKLCSKQEHWAKARMVVFDFVVKYAMTEFAKKTKVEGNKKSDAEKYREFVETFKKTYGITGISPQTIEARASATPPFRPETAAVSTSNSQPSDEEHALAVPQLAVKTPI